MCVFTCDCFSYLLIYFLQIFVSLKISQPLYSLSGFMNKDLQRSKQALQAPLRGEERGVWEYDSVVNAGDMSPS